ncbi:MAG: hypothetical protein ACK41D_02280 [Rubricoccaceae bacterium]
MTPAAAPPAATPPAAATLLLEAIYAAGEEVLGALARQDYDGALAHAQARETLVAQLARAEAAGAGLGAHQAACAGRLVAQYAALSEALAAHQEALEDALRETARHRHAADRYTEEPASPPGRLRASG